MTRMDHVMQIGKPGESPKIYLEDYVYTYLKRQEDTEKKKYYLYGEREGSQALEKLYIYGISDSAKEENTYFKDYYSLGLLKIRNGEKVLVNRKGQEKPISGFFVFYAPNQAMQEYLVDTSVGKKEEEKIKSQPSRQPLGRSIPIREKIVLSPPNFKKGKKGVDVSSMIFYMGCIAALLLLGMAVSGGNGYHKLAAFKQMVMQTMNSMEGEKTEQEFIVEEKRIGGESAALEESLQQSSLPVDTVVPAAAAEPQATVPAAAADSQATAPAAAVDSQATTPTAAVDSQVTAPAADSQAAIPDEMAVSQTISPASQTAQAEEAGETALTVNKITTVDKQPEEVNYESYIVQEGDTLAKICQARYGSTEKMQEICDYNKIENEDYIAPGQKLYLP